MITVEVALFATLRKYHPGGDSSEPFLLEIPEGSSVLDLLNQLQIPPEESWHVFIDSHSQERGYILQNGERVALFPAIAGG